MRKRLTYANVMATLAFFFALTGGAMAAGKYLLSTDTIPSTSDLAGSTYGSPVIAAGAVTNAKLANSSLSVNAGTSLTGGGSVSLGGSTSLGVADGGIGTTQLADGSVTSGKLADGSVGTTKIADGSVTSAKLGAGSVGTVNLADSSVTGAKLAAGVRMWAVMTANGTLTDGSGALTNPNFTGKFSNSTGAYQVQFNTTITHCSAVATPSILGEQSTSNGVAFFPAMAFVSRTSSSQIAVNIYDASGSPLDEGFTLAVFC